MEKKIALITNSIRVFKTWRSVHGRFGEKYIHIQSLEDIRGRYFNGYELLHGHNDIKQIGELINQIKLRIKP